MLRPLVFVDLETTGATATADRITEIGIVEVSDTGVSEWSALVNPQTRISEFIERLTGISNDMVAVAPTFDALAGEVLERLRGRLFIAHNARFDYGFLKSEFKRAGHDFRATVLCTVKLSRRLYPGHARHNLDALVGRHDLSVSDRHRALGDARLIWQFWQKAVATVGAEALESAVAELTARPGLPPHIDEALIEALPEGHGVYLFYAENDLPLYIGRSNNVRERVWSHFGADHVAAKDASLLQQVRRIDWVETEGELGALLKQADLVKRLSPTHNRRFKENRETFAWRGISGAAGLELKSWPYSGPVGVKEGAQIHVLDQWRYLGTAATDAELAEVLTTAMPPFDAGICKLLVKHVGKRTTKLVPLRRAPLPAVDEYA